MPARTPDELIDLLNGAPIQPRPDINTDPRPWLREVLGIILPEYGRDLRTLIAAEIEAACVSREWPNDDVSQNGRLAVQIARGED